MRLPINSLSPASEEGADDSDRAGRSAGWPSRSKRLVSEREDSSEWYGFEIEIFDDGPSSGHSVSMG